MKLSLSRFWALLVLATLLWVSAPARAALLNIGDPAPKLAVKQFLKGQPIKGFETDKVYVVEFWATWCGPCRITIPHLSDLQKKYPNVTFVGVSVWENDQKAVKPFVDGMGGKMAYRVAMDSVPPGVDPRKGIVASAWMVAAGEHGLPTAFVIAGGKVAWIGHPGEVDEPLRKIVAGKWDLHAAATTRKREQARAARLEDLGKRVDNAPTAAARLKVIDQALASDPSLLGPVGPMKLQLMVEQRVPVPPAFVNKLIGAFKSDPQSLSVVAATLVDPSRPNPPGGLARLALTAAKEADRLTDGQDVGAADILARSYFVSGNPAKAVEAQQRALRMAPPALLARDPGIKTRLAQYQKAAAGRR